MLYLVRRQFGSYRPGEYIRDPSWPAQNLKALVSQLYLELMGEDPKVEASAPKVKAKELPTKQRRVRS